MISRISSIVLIGLVTLYTMKSSGQTTSSPNVEGCYGLIGNPTFQMCQYSEDRYGITDRFLLNSREILLARGEIWCPLPYRYYQLMGKLTDVSQVGYRVLDFCDAANYGVASRVLTDVRIPKSQENDLDFFISSFKMFQDGREVPFELAKQTSSSPGVYKLKPGAAKAVVTFKAANAQPADFRLVTLGARSGSQPSVYAKHTISEFSSGQSVVIEYDFDASSVSNGFVSASADIYPSSDVYDYNNRVVRDYVLSEPTRTQISIENVRIGQTVFEPAVDGNTTLVSGKGAVVEVTLKTNLRSSGATRMYAVAYLDAKGFKMSTARPSVATS